MVVENENYWNVSDEFSSKFYMSPVQRSLEVGLSDFVCYGRTPGYIRATTEPEPPPFEDCAIGLKRKFVQKPKFTIFVLMVTSYPRLYQCEKSINGPLT